MQFVNNLSPFFALVVQAVAVIVVLLGIEWRSRRAQRNAGQPEPPRSQEASPRVTATEAPA
jgi:hypothetical protein